MSAAVDQSDWMGPGEIHQRSPYQGEGGAIQMRSGVEILQSFWAKGAEGKWAITHLRGVSLAPAPGCEPDFFKPQQNFEFPRNPRGMSSLQLMESLGSTSTSLKHSIVPVVALVDGANHLRVIGTAFVVSASGLVMTAAHVLLDPEDSGYGDATDENGAVRFDRPLQMGVLLPLPSSLYGRGAVRFAPFKDRKFWGGWRRSPLFHERDRVDFDTDVAICRLPPHPSGAYQPLNMSLRSVAMSEQVFAVGYAEMADIPVRYEGDTVVLSHFTQDLFVSVGTTTAVHDDNAQTRSVSTPGPCFEFDAKIPGKMSGAPILGGDGAVIRGVVSRSFSGERHAFGASLGPAAHLPLFDNKSLRDMMLEGTEGIPRIEGLGL